MDTPILETERLILRPLSLNDAEHIFKTWTSDPDVEKYMIWDLHQSINDTISWLKTEVAELTSNNNYTWGMVFKENNELFGTISIHRKDTSDVFTLGYNIAKSYWGNGFTTEAGKTVLDFASSKLNIKKFFCRHADENIASMKVMKKLGFIYFNDSSYESFSGKKHFKSKDYFLDLNIKTPKLDDAKDMARIITDCWKNSYKNILPKEFLDNLSYEDRENKIKSSILGAYEKFTSNMLIYSDELVKGVAFYGKNICDLPKNFGEIIVLYVDINEQRRGIGRKLVSYIKNELKQNGFTDMIIWCLKDNFPSIEFYKSMGGIVSNERDFEIDGNIYKEVGIMYKL